MKYRDGLGYEFEVPEEQVKAFEKRRRIALIISIIVECIIIGGFILLTASRNQ